MCLILAGKGIVRRQDMQESKNFLNKNTIFRWIAAKVIRHGIKQSQHGKNNVRKTGGKPSNRREEIREQKARGERNKRKRKGYKHSK